MSEPTNTVSRKDHDPRKDKKRWEREEEKKKALEALKNNKDAKVVNAIAAITAQKKKDVKPMSILEREANDGGTTD